MIRKFSILLLLPITLLVALQFKKGSDLPGSLTGQDLSIEWELVTNNYCGKNCYKSNIILTNQGKFQLSRNWVIYFTHSVCRRIHLDSIPKTVQLIHIAGDFYKIIPTQNFPILEPNESFTLPIISNDFVIKYSDAPSGFYIVFDKGESKPELISDVKIKPFTKTEQLLRGKYDHYPIITSEIRFHDNEGLSLVPVNQICPIIPTPVKLSFLKDSVLLSENVKVHYHKAFKAEAEYLSLLLKKIFHRKIFLAESLESGSGIISLQKFELSFSNALEAYQLNIQPNLGINITANTEDGIFYGIQSLRALFPLDAEANTYKQFKVPSLNVEDYPQFTYRGMLLDVARNFQNKESIKKLIESLSFYKINTLQLHLADDEGWRIEIPSLPELTDVSSRRGHTSNESDQLIPAYGSGPFGNTTLSNGFFSKQDFIELLQFAKAHHVAIIPAIDLPGHARAAIKAMESRYHKLIAKGSLSSPEYLLTDLNDRSSYLSVQQYSDNVICPCQESTYNFLERVVQEIKTMYEEAGVQLMDFHLSSDEVPEGVWKKSTVCKEFLKTKKLSNNEDIKSYFLKRASSILKNKQINMGVYEDGLVVKGSNNGPAKIRKDLIDKNTRIYSWNNLYGEGNEDLCYQLANGGNKVILMHVTNLYLDQAYSNDPSEPGFYWGGFVDTKKIFEYTPLHISHCAYSDRMGNPIPQELFNNKIKLSSQGIKNIIGIQGALFSETLKHPGMMEYYAFPKVLALAERAWAKEPEWAKEENQFHRIKMLQQDWNRFANQLGHREFIRLNYLAGGYNYHFPSPGIIVETGQFKINSPFPGLQIRYTLNGENPNRNSLLYDSPVHFNGTIKAALFTKDGRMGKVGELKHVTLK
jgi:hexosaminidase